MKSLTVSEFRKQCLTLIEDLPKTGVIVTKRGRPVAKLIPIEQKVDNSWMFGSLKGKLTVKGDIMSTGVQWDAES
jgi:prevent-host-death family protein